MAVVLELNKSFCDMRVGCYLWLLGNCGTASLVSLILNEVKI